ncbi:MAG: ABC transporter substrate-binding protein [Eubacteriales bacterium]|nr:ABC transporter substrate-binding protein [Eubacteriales bacterium]
MNRKRGITVWMAGVMLLAALTGCGTQPAAETGSGSAEEQEAIQADVTAVDSFSLAYRENDSLNPQLCTSAENKLMLQLCFESLFQLDDSFTPQAGLCADIEQNSSKSYTLTVRSGVKFHSGEELTAEDVAYSLNHARERENSTYQEQLACISSVKYQEDTVHIRLSSAKSLRELEALLDVPIFRKGSDEEDIPDGTGPYQMVSSDTGMKLNPFDQWNGGAVGFCGSITLVSVSDSNSAANLLSSGDISLLLQPDAENAAATGSEYTSSVPTTRLHYLGINCEWEPLDDPDVRTALSMLMDRDTIVQTCFSGRADAAALPVASVPDDVDAPEYDKEEALELLEDAGIYDRDDDGYLDISKNKPFAVEIIYNVSYGTKGAVLEQYANTLDEVGIQVTVTPLEFAECQTKLRRETFQMYYGEYEMTADFDFSSIVSRNGERNFGTYSSSQMEKALTALHAAEEDEWEDAQADYLKCFMEETPVIPIAFERSVIASSAPLPEGFGPWPHNIFHGIESWSAS